MNTRMNSQGLRNRNRNVGVLPAEGILVQNDKVGVYSSLYVASVQVERRKVGLRMSGNWDLLFWLVAAFAVLYFTDFASHLLFNPAVRR